MTFDELWPVLGIPGEFDAMDQCDQMRWRGVLQQAFDAGQADAQRTAAVWENEAREQALQALASEGQWIEQTGALQRRIAELEAQRVPLTDEQIADAVREADLDWHHGWTLDETEANRFTQLVRAVERAHGIEEVKR